MSKGAVAILLSVFLGLTAEIPAYDTIDAVDDISAMMIDGLPAASQAELYNHGKTGRFYFDGDPRTAFLPATPLSRPITTDIDGLEPNIGVESLYLFRAPGIQPGDEEQLLRIYNLTRRLSSLEGIEYFSASRNRMRTFFKRFFTIAGPEDPAKLADPLVDEIPVSETVYAFQEDLTFGENISKIEYRYSEPFIGLSISNMEKMKYAFIPLIPEGGMQMHLIVFVLEDHIVFYGNCAVSTVEFLGLVRKKKESFSNRIEAMYRWFRREFESLNLT